MNISNQQARKELKSLMDKFQRTNRSQKIRCELGAAIEAMYIADILTRSEYRSLMEEIR
jgi:hypothetical protein